MGMQWYLGYLVGRHVAPMGEPMGVKFGVVFGCSFEILTPHRGVSIGQLQSGSLVKMWADLLKGFQS